MTRPGCRKGSRLSDLLVRQAEDEAGDTTLGDIARALRNRSIVALLLFLALPTALPVQVPGVSSLFGVPLMLLSTQLMLRRERLWLPSRIAARTVKRADFERLVAAMLPWVRRFERVLRPRLSWAAQSWAMVPVGAVCLVLSTIIALPIPLGHVIPSWAIAVIALGVLERDGLAVAVGIALALLGFALIIAGTAGVLLLFGLG